MVPRKLIILAVILPLAAIVGYYLATPDSRLSYALVGLVLGILTIPLWLKWHHPILIFSWNAAIELFFLPGSPRFWMIAAVISGGISLMSHILDKNRKEYSGVVASIAIPLVVLALIVLVTGMARGGFGVHALGAESFGGRQYLLIFLAVVGYFGIAGRKIASEKAMKYAGIFFLTSLIALLSNLVYVLGPAFYFLYVVFPASYAFMQASADLSITGTPVLRFAGFLVASLGVWAYLIARFGISGILDLRKPWRLALLLLVLFAGLMGGFRSSLIMFFLLFAIQFALEGLIKTRLFPTLILLAVLFGAVLVPIAGKLPLAVQRSISFLPVEIDPIARMDAQGTSEWRFRMWKLLVAEVPRYVWFGKGCAFNPAEYYLVLEAVKRGTAEDIEAYIMTGGYHNGPLTVIIPFGIWGCIAFLWLVLAGLRLLYRNHRYSPPELQSVNTLLLSFFIMKVVFYMVIYGHFSEDLAAFCGILGLSCSLNGGIRKPSDVEVFEMPQPSELAAVPA